MVLDLLTDFSVSCPCVGGDGNQGSDSAIREQPGRLVAVAHHEDVVSSAEGVLEDGSGNQIDLRIMTRCLTSGGAVVVPVGEVLRTWGKHII